MSHQAEYPVKVSSDYRSLLLELTIAYLIKQPSNSIDFALDFFTEKNKERFRDSWTSGDIDDDDDIDYYVRYARKCTLYAGSIDPETDMGEGEITVYPKSRETKKKLLRGIKNLFIFRHLHENQMEQLLDVMQVWHVKKGNTVITEGEEGDYFYIVDKGQFLAYRDDGETKRIIRTYDEEGCFGELSLIYNEPRYFSVQALTDGVLYALDRESFRKIVVKRAFEKRRRLCEILASVEYLKSLNEEELTSVVDTLQSRAYKPGQHIFRQGDYSDGMYIIEEGEVELTKEDLSGQVVTVGRMSAGQYLGEISLVVHCSRPVTATAVDNVYISFLDVEAFERILGPCWEIIKRDEQRYQEQMAKICSTNLRSEKDLRK